MKDISDFEPTKNGRISIQGKGTKKKGLNQNHTFAEILSLCLSSVSHMHVSPLLVFSAWSVLQRVTEGSGLVGGQGVCRVSQSWRRSGLGDLSMVLNQPHCGRMETPHHKMASPGLSYTSVNQKTIHPFET